MSRQLTHEGIPIACRRCSYIMRLSVIGIMTDSLTVAEKILFHLFQYIKSEDKYEVPCVIAH